MFALQDYSVPADPHRPRLPVGASLEGKALLAAERIVASRVAP